MSNIEQIINKNFENRAEISPLNATEELKDAVNEAIADIDHGTLRVAEKKNGEWELATLSSPFTDIRRTASSVTGCQLPDAIPGPP